MRDYCDAQAGFWLNSKFWSKFSRPKFTPEYPPPPPILENFKFGMTKVYFGIPPPPHFGKLQIWDDQSLLRNTPPFWKIQILDDQTLLRNTPPPPPILENFRFGMTKVYSGIPPPNENCPRVQVRDFQNTESYYMWRFYPTRINY